MGPPRVRIGNERYLVFSARDVLEDLDEAEARRFLDEVVRSDIGCGGAREIIDAAEELSFEYPLGIERACEIVARALACGDLVLIRGDGSWPALGQPSAGPGRHLPHEPIAPAKETTFVAATIVHESGAGYPGVAFDVELPAGEVRTIELDAASSFRIDDVPDSGSCRLRPLRHRYELPDGDLDRRAIVRRGDDVLATVGDDGPLRLRTGMEHRVVVGELHFVLRVRLQVAGRVLAGEAYVLTVAGAEIEGTTNAQGMLETPVPAAATSAQLHLVDRGETCDLQIVGELPPPAAEPGASIRLHNLGAGRAAPHVDADDRRSGALRGFQRAEGLPVTGALDAPTAGALERRHGC
jgi:hypothetical protein